MQRVVEQFLLRRNFDDVAQIHHSNTVADVFDNAQVVRNEDVRQLIFPLQFAHQIQNLRLNRHVQRADRLVADNQLRVERQCARNADALPLSAGKLVRIARVDLFAQTNVVHELQHAGAALLLVAHVVDNQRLLDAAPDREARVKGGIRVLVDNLNLLGQVHVLLAVHLREQVKAANRSRRSYRDFLRRFCVTREEVHLDPDEFDLNFYTYGLSVYGNMPLIEPLETRESKKIEELALVIDTSYSTSGELVRAFLAETYTLLKGRENFFHRMNLHLIQADNAVRQDLLVRNEDELIHAMNHFQLRGGGGTDFRPAFAYVSQLCAEKKFSNLRGLLYFTDGMGSYPARRPAYDTAFLFLGDRFDDANVPPWAMKVVLDEDEFTGPSAKAASALAEALNDEDDPYRELNNT